MEYHSKKLYQFINDQYTVRPDEAFRFAVGSFIENVWFVLVDRKNKGEYVNINAAWNDSDHLILLNVSLSEINNKFMYWQFPLFFVYKQERSNHTFSMNESNDEKKSSILTDSIN